jgi:uncharacterized protein DUF5666
MKKSTESVKQNPLVSEPTTKEGESLVPETDKLKEGKSVLDSLNKKDEEEKVVKNKKSKFVSFIIPLIIIAVLGCLLYYFLVFQNSKKEKDIIALPTPQEFFLAVDNLKEEITTINGELIVKGKTLPNSTVAIYSDIDETIVESDADGFFQETLVVEETGGLIRVTAYNQNGEEKSVTFEVTESDSVLGDKDKKPNQGKKDDNPGNNDKDESKENSNKDKDKEDKGQNDKDKDQSPSASASNKSDKEEKELDKEAKAAEKADFLADKLEFKQEKKIGATNMVKLLNQFKDSTESGKVKNNYKFKKMEVAEASAGAKLKRHSVSGIITSISDNTITIAHQTQQDRTWTIYYNDSTTITGKENKQSGDTEASGSASGASLVVGARITTVGIPTDDGILATRIHIIPGKAIGVYEKLSESTASASPTASPSASPSPEASPPPTATASATPEATP